MDAPSVDRVTVIIQKFVKTRHMFDKVLSLVVEFVLKYVFTRCNASIDKIKCLINSRAGLNAFFVLFVFFSSPEYKFRDRPKRIFVTPLKI